ncbi:hypothetical protein BEWA_051690 [Theileria equi strain WA]|uniref:Uncharacterized protein n=1 Tax=Theileria equi strain WA TaxID=1537102 RepID=L1LCY5_THEEQ|nr:hypothetical protein BEWA_051690 [Theileria equi strain WA]EKX73115.1 hypothetical protein BEWA_051690 [Theileria equi strain WA]|eukprot:XP_004832567.1 hypothetical protein BEWA_051690 [Theileria equi strain WA]
MNENLGTIQQANTVVFPAKSAEKKVVDRKRLAENLRRSIEAHKNRLAMARKSSKQEPSRSTTESRTTLGNRYIHNVRKFGHDTASEQIHVPTSMKHTQSSLNKIHATATIPYVNPNCKVHGINNNGISSLNEPSPMNIQIVTPNASGNSAGFDNHSVQYCSARVCVNSPSSDTAIGNTASIDDKHVLKNAELSENGTIKDTSSDDLRKLILGSGISEDNILELLRHVVMEILTGKQSVTQTSIENDPGIKNLLSYCSNNNSTQTCTESTGKQDKLMNLLLNCISTSIAASTKEDTINSSRSNKSVNVEINLNMQNPDTEGTFETSRPIENKEPVTIEPVFNKNSEGVSEIKESVSLLDRLKTWAPNLGFFKGKSNICGDCTKAALEIGSLTAKHSCNLGWATQEPDANAKNYAYLHVPSVNNDIKTQLDCKLVPNLRKSIFKPRYQTRTSTNQGDGTYPRIESRSISMQGTRNINIPILNSSAQNVGSNTIVPDMQRFQNYSNGKHLTPNPIPTDFGGKYIANENNNGYFVSQNISSVRASNIMHDNHSSYNSFNCHSENFFSQPHFVPLKMGTAPLNMQDINTNSTPSWTPKATFIPATRAFHNAPRIIHPVNTGIPSYVQDLYGARNTHVGHTCAIHGSPIDLSNGWNPNSQLVSSKSVVDTLNFLGKLNHKY